MLKIDRDNQKFSPLDTPTLSEASITERYDLQEYICNTPEAFFNEIGQELFLLGKEITPSDNVQDRIDILAVDKEGVCVVVELKRGSHKLHMMQAVSYAGMIAQWSSDYILQQLDDNQQEELTDFLKVETTELNRRQRIILVAEAFDYALLVGAEWLSENFNVNIMCCRISVAKDDSNSNEYLVCSNVYPAPELAQQAVPRGRRGSGNSKLKWSDWDAAFEKVNNTVLIDFFRSQLEQGQENLLKYRTLFDRINGKRRGLAKARQTRAYAWQYGRFDNDVK